MKNRPPFNQAYTFDDVLLVPQYSQILPSAVDLKTRLTSMNYVTCILSSSMN